MIRSLRRLISPIAAMVVILALGAATPAHAAGPSLEMWVAETSPLVQADQVGATGTQAGTQSTSYTNANFGGNLNIVTLSSSADSPGSPTFAYVSGSQTFLQNTSGVSVTVYMSLGNINYSAPTGLVSVLSSVSATVAAAGTGANSLSFTSYVDNTNTQNTTVGTSQTIPLSITSPGATSNSVTFAASPTSPFAISELFAITLSAGAAITFSSSTDLTQTAPEPSSTVLGGIGILGMIGYGLRRRKALGA